MMARSTWESVDKPGLLLQIQQSDPAAIETFYRLLTHGTRYLIKRRVPQELVEDILQDTLIDALRAIREGRIRCADSLPSYIRSIVVHKCAHAVNELAHDRCCRAPELEYLRLPDRREPADASVAREERSAQAARALASMKPKEREVLERFYLGEQPPEQICREMEMTETQFRLVKSRAKARLGALTLKIIRARGIWLPQARPRAAGSGL